MESQTESIATSPQSCGNRKSLEAEFREANIHMYKSLSARIKATQGIETPPELDKDNQLKSLNIVRLVYASLTEGEQKKVDLLFTLTVGVDLGKMIQE